MMRVAPRALLFVCAAVVHVPAAERTRLLPQPQRSSPGPQATKSAHQQGRRFSSRRLKEQNVIPDFPINI